MFSLKDCIQDGLRSRVVYKVVCAGCIAWYVGESVWHFSSRVKEHLASVRASHIFKHLENSEHCRALCSADCFHVLDQAFTSFRLEIKEATRRERPSLNQEVHYVNVKVLL